MTAETTFPDASGGHRPPLKKIILGSRGSELARAQTAMVARALQNAWPDLEIQLEIIKTRGDERSAEATESINPRAGRKGLFTGEIERVLAASGIDIAVHSAKDLPSESTPGLEVRSVLPRAAVVGNIHRFSSLIFAAMFRRACADWRQTRGMGLCWPAPA